MKGNPVSGWKSVDQGRAAFLCLLLLLSFPGCLPSHSGEPNALASRSANTAPTISSIPNQTMNWNTVLGPLPFTVGDAETPDDLTVTASSSNSSLFPENGILIEGTGARRTLSLTPYPEEFGTTIVTVIVTDPEQLTATNQFVLTVNSAPMIVYGLSDQTVISGLPVGPLSFTVKDRETPATNLTVSARTSDPVLLPKIILGGSGADRSITVVSAAGQTTPAEAAVTVSVSDGALTTSETFRVTVTVSPGCPPDAFAMPGFENDHINTTNVQLFLSTRGGVPAQMAILVNSTNFDGATWVPFDPAPIVNLGSDGAYWVHVGVRCSSTEFGRWFGTELVVDRVPPEILGVSPTNHSQLTTPNLHLTGHSREELGSVTYDLFNAEGETLDRTANIERSEFNERTFAYGRTDFETMGLVLAEGTNTVVLHVADLAGNQRSMTLEYTLDYSLDKIAPIATITFPEDGELIGGPEFAISGTVDDNTAHVWAVVVGDGQTNQVFGGVSRSGHFTTSPARLRPGPNIITVFAIDDAGNQSQTPPVTVGQSNVPLTMDPVEIRTGAPWIKVTGTVGPAHSVSVNGVPATVAAGHWSAMVPVPGDLEPFVATATRSAVQTDAVSVLEGWTLLESQASPREAFLDPLSFAGAPRLQLRIGEVDPRRVEIQISPDLSTWVAWTNVTTIDHRFMLIDPEPTPTGNLFHRALVK